MENILRLSVVDALDEDAGAVFIFCRNVAHDDPSIAASDKAGRAHVDVNAAIVVQPLRDASGSPTRRLQLTRFATARCPKAALKLLKWTPAWLMRSAIDKAFSDEAATMGPFMRNSEILARVIATSPRADLYRRLAAHVGEEAANLKVSALGE